MRDEGKGMNEKKELLSVFTSSLIAATLIPALAGGTDP
jgi:hypothetical protein